MRRLVFAIAAGLLASGTPVRAEWREARTDHFILTIDDTEDAARALATRLERFDAAMRKLYNVTEDPQRPVRPIRIYMLQDRLFATTCRCPGALGFYRSGTAGSMIVAAHLTYLDKKETVGAWSSQTLLLHEYSHYFAFTHFPIAYPVWFTEGFAEFNAATVFKDDGAVEIGYPANYRGAALFGGSSMPTRKLLDPFARGFGNMDLFYGRGWLLTHYLILAPTRRGQLATYLTALNSGETSLEAADKAFGDLGQLDRELNAYLRAQLAPPLRIPPGSLSRVTVFPLSRGQAEMLPIYLLGRVGLAQNYRLGPAQSAAKIAARHPGDAVVQLQWAQMEYAADRLDQADKAADAALAIDSLMVDALVRKGMIAVQRAVESRATDAATWTAARAWYLKANRIDPNAVMPLFLFHQSFVAAKSKPSVGAIKALQRAKVLAPESSEVGVALARQMLADGDAQSARALLQPIAFTPHRKAAKNIPLDAIALIDAGKLAEAKAALDGESDEE